jgi:Spy/CpxP family protein refolding chaperone
MKRKSFIGTLLLAGMTALLFTACYNRSPEARIGWIKDEITERLELNADQQAMLDRIAADMMERGKQMHQGRDEARATLMAELKKERMDRATIEDLVARKRQQMDEMTDYLIDNALAFHETLNPQQREKLAAELEKLQARAEKYHHRRW